METCPVYFEPSPRCLSSQRGISLWVKLFVTSDMVILQRPSQINRWHEKWDFRARCEASVLSGVWRFYSKKCLWKVPFQFVISEIITQENKLLNTQSKGTGTRSCSPFVNHYGTSQTHPYKILVFPIFQDFFFF